MSNLGDRRTYIGCSELAAVCGYGGWDTPHDVWEYKTGRTPGKRQTPIMRRGHDQEVVIARLYREQTKRKVVRKQEEFIDPARPWLKYHADGMVGYIPNPKQLIEVPEGDVGPVEFKAPNVRTVSGYLDSGLPTDYIFQAAGGMHCSKTDWLGYGVYDYENHKVIDFDVPRNQQFIDDMLASVDVFWECVQTDTPPPEVVRTIEIPNLDGDLVCLNGSEYEDLAAMWVASKTAVKQYELELGEVESEIKVLMNDANYGLIQLGLSLRVSNKWSEGGKGYLKQQKIVDWTAELCSAIRSGDTDRVMKMASGYRPGNFYTPPKPRQNFRPTPQGEHKEAINAVK